MKKPKDPKEELTKEAQRALELPDEIKKTVGEAFISPPDKAKIHGRNAGELLHELRETLQILGLLE